LTIANTLLIGRTRERAQLNLWPRTLNRNLLLVAVALGGAQVAEAVRR
jgi:hypothetical protein